MYRVYDTCTSSQTTFSPAKEPAAASSAIEPAADFTDDNANTWSVPLFARMSFAQVVIYSLGCML